MLIVRPEQLSTFEQESRRLFEEALVDHCYQFSPLHSIALSRDQMLLGMRRAMSRAQTHGIQGDSGIRLFMELSLLFGSSFDRDPVHAWTHKILAASAPEKVKLYGLYQGAVKYQLMVEGERHEFLRSSLLNIQCLDGQGGLINMTAVEICELVRRVFPQKYQYVGGKK